MFTVNPIQCYNTHIHILLMCRLAKCFQVRMKFVELGSETVQTLVLLCNSVDALI